MMTQQEAPGFSPGSTSLSRYFRRKLYEPKFCGSSGDSEPLNMRLAELLEILGVDTAEAKGELKKNPGEGGVRRGVGERKIAMGNYNKGYNWKLIKPSADKKISRNI